MGNFLKRIGLKYKKILNWINKNKVVLILLLIGLGLFCWFQVRPSVIYSYCSNIAKEKAMKSFKDKLEISPSYEYEKAAEKGMFLKDDYEYLYKRCLREKGINK